MTKHTNIWSRMLMGVLACLSAFYVLSAGESPSWLTDASRVMMPAPEDKKPVEMIRLLHSDVLYKSLRDYDRADVLVGHVKLLHEGMYLDCDSARYFKESNSFNAYGNVKMWQGDTLTLTCDTLLYDGFQMQMHGRGRCVLTHRKTVLKTEVLDYFRVEGVGVYPNGGTLIDEGNTLVSDWGQYTPSTHEAFFTNNVNLSQPDKFELRSDTLYYYTDVKRAKIVTFTNIDTSDSTHVYGYRGDYDTNTGVVNLMDRSYIIKDMRDIVGDSLYYDKETGLSEAFGNVVLIDRENQCTFTGNYCNYNELTGAAVATDSALCMEYSQGDTLYIHADTLKMFTFNKDTDSTYHDMHAYRKVRMFRTDVQAVCDSMVMHELDSCTYMYGQPIMWNEEQQVFGEEIRIYNNDSTINWIHIINQAMTIEKIDSISFNQVSSKEMFCYFKDGQLEHNEAKGNVIVSYFMDESDGNRIGMNYSESAEMRMYIENKKMQKIWMPAGTCTVHPAIMIPDDRRYLPNFAWFDYIRPVDKYDVFLWRGKDEKNVLKATEARKVPLQKLE